MRLLKRIAVGALLISVVFGATWLHPLGVAGLVALWSLLATREYVGLVRRAGTSLSFALLGPAVVILPIALGVQYLRHPNALTTDLPPALLIPLALVGIQSLFARAPRGPRLVYGVFAVVYLSLLPSHLVLLRLYCLNLTDGWLVALVPLVATWVNDTAAYGLGRALGRHKLSPEISPNKTWEGFLAGLVVTAGFSAGAAAWLLPGVGVPAGAALGLVLGLAAQVGDLVESVFKREAGVKDSSGALLEHGGFLDRADSLVFTIPVFYYCLLLFRT